MKKAVTSKNRKRGGRLAWEAAAVCAAFLEVSQPSRGAAQSICGEAACPSEFVLSKETALQKVPTVFKFQSRISQARLPVGDAKLATVIVNLNGANSQTLCTETLSNVMVRDSVLNIDIGRGMSCQLDEVIAANNDLSFQICIGGNENCLKPVALGTVPQAIKASFAKQAQEAYKSQIAAQSHFAHRITPEADLFTTNTISKGYYDFQTPTVNTTMTGTLVTNPQTYVGGYIQWTPVSPGDNELHLSSATKSGVARTLGDLANFFVHATSTNVMGTLTTEKALTVKTGGADVTGGIVVKPTSGVSMVTLDVRGSEVVGGPLTVSPTGPGTALTVTTGGAAVAGGLTVTNGNLDVAGTSTLRGALTVTTGGANITGATTLNGAATIGVSGGTNTITGTTNFVGTVNLPAGTGVTVGTANIADGSVTNAKLAGGITSAKLAGGITNAQLAGGITSAKLAGGITNAQLAGGITSAKLAGGITSDKLANPLASLVVTSLTSGNIALAANAHISLNSATKSYHNTYYRDFAPYGQMGYDDATLSLEVSGASSWGSLAVRHASLVLPHGAKITGAGCTFVKGVRGIGATWSSNLLNGTQHVELLVYDITANMNLVGTYVLDRWSHTTVVTVGSDTSSTKPSTTEFVMSTPVTVDNTKYVYVVRYRLDHPSTLSTWYAHMRGCRIVYTGGQL